MSDTQAAMREYRFLDDKRKTGGLSVDEEQRWQFLGINLGIVVPPEEPLGQWGTDGLWYPAPLPPNQQVPGGWDPGILGLGYEPNSGAWWDPQAQAWLQPQTWEGDGGMGAVPATGSMPPQTGSAEPAVWSAPPLPAEKSLGSKAPWQSVASAPPAPVAVPEADGPMEVSDDEVMEVSDDDVQLIAEPPQVKVPPAPRPPPPMAPPEGHRIPSAPVPLAALPKVEERKPEPEPVPEPVAVAPEPVPEPEPEPIPEPVAVAAPEPIPEPEPEPIPEPVAVAAPEPIPEPGPSRFPSRLRSRPPSRFRNPSPSHPSPFQSPNRNRFPSRSPRRLLPRRRSRR